MGFCAFVRVKYEYQFGGSHYQGTRWVTGTDAFNEPYWSNTRHTSAFTERLMSLGTCD